MPPVGGWTLTGAFEALCPQQMRLYRRGGAELWEAAWTVLPPWEAGVPHPNPDPWRAAQLLAALCDRPDLQLTGHDLAKGVGAERFRLPHYLLLAAVQGDTKDFSFKHRPWLALDIRKETARIGCEIVRHDDLDMPERYPETVELIAVRVEATTGAGTATRPEFSERALRGWFVMRVRTWPKDQAPPTRDDCWADARAFFGRHIPRDTLRRVRRDMVPPPWNKTGRRRPPN